MTTPTAKELVEAAEALREGNSHSWPKSISLLARHVLATIHEDDDEPITDEWANEVGFTGLVQMGREKIYAAEYADGTLNVVVFTDGWWAMHGRGQNHQATRGNVRKLIAAMGSR